MKNNLRAKSLLAALALSLALTTGAAAQSASLPVSAELEREADDICQVSIFAGGTFGVWKRDGSSYEFDPSSTGSPESTVFINGNIDSQPAAGCNITVAFDGLSNGAGGTIDADNFEAYSYWMEEQDDDGRVDAEGWTHTRVTGVEGAFGRTYDWEYTLEDVPDELEIGVYSGDVSITFSNAQ